MAKFDLITNAPDHIRKKSQLLDRSYYQIDTADTNEVSAWIGKNPYITTHAVVGDEHLGYFNLTPITSDAARLFDIQEMSEEDLLPEHILAPDVMRYAQYFYLPAITVKNFMSVRSRMAVAALMSGLGSYVFNVFTPERIKRIYASPTTFQGNSLLRRLGFKPVSGVRKLLASSDVYYIDVTDETLDKLQWLQQRYARYINSNCWEDPAVLSLLSVRQ